MHTEHPTNPATNLYKMLKPLKINGLRYYLASEVMHKLGLTDLHLKDLPERYKSRLPNDHSSSGDWLLSELGMALLSIKSGQQDAHDLLSSALCLFVEVNEEFDG